MNDLDKLREQAETVFGATPSAAGQDARRDWIRRLLDVADPERLGEPYNVLMTDVFTVATEMMDAVALTRTPSPSEGVREAVPREPTERMVAAGHRAWREFVESWGDEPVSGTSASAVWRAMYDAALASSTVEETLGGEG